MGSGRHSWCFKMVAWRHCGDSPNRCTGQMMSTGQCVLFPGHIRDNLKNAHFFSCHFRLHSPWIVIVFIVVH